jgi:hypothetical protein
VTWPPPASKCPGHKTWEDHCEVVPVGPEPVVVERPAPRTPDGKIDLAAILDMEPAPPRPTSRVWTCSHCGAKGEWTDTWSYWGSLECKYCWMADMEWVACSAACAEALGAPRAKAGKALSKRMLARKRRQVEQDLVDAKHNLERLEAQLRGLDDEP